VGKITSVTAPDSITSTSRPNYTGKITRIPNHFNSDDSIWWQSEQPWYSQFPAILGFLGLIICTAGICMCLCCQKPKKNSVVTKIEYLNDGAKGRAPPSEIQYD
jgi:hypothetical protein